jgi:hypothetical protein
MNCHLNIRKVAFTIVLLLTFSSSPIFAVDEEYFIPYTDNYGYEYDPETGTYIKKEPPPEAMPQQTTQKTGTQINKSVASIQAAAPQASATSENDKILLSLPVLISSLVGIMILSLILARIFRKQEP